MMLQVKNQKCYRSETRKAPRYARREVRGVPDATQELLFMASDKTTKKKFNMKLEKNVPVRKEEFQERERTRSSLDQRQEGVPEAREVHATAAEKDSPCTDYRLHHNFQALYEFL